MCDCTWYNMSVFIQISLTILQGLAIQNSIFAHGEQNIRATKIKRDLEKQEGDNNEINGLSERIQQNLFQSYSKADVPDLTKPTEVKLSTYINSFDAIRNSDMSYDVHMYFRMQWLDPRLKFDWLTIQSWNDSKLSYLSNASVPEVIYLLPDYINNKMFIPDVFFR